MSILLYTVILWMPALVIFPLTRLMQAYISSNHSQPYGDHLLIIRNMYHSNKIEISELNNYKKAIPGHSLYETAYRHTGYITLKT